MNNIKNIGYTVLIAALPLSAKGDQGRSEPKHEQVWIGTITVVDTKAKTLTGEHWRFAKSFDLGQKCAISTVDNKEAALGDLRPGEKVNIRYQQAEGVLVADRITEQALRYDGRVQSVDQKAGTITMEERPLYQPFHAAKRFQIAGDCKVLRWNGQEGRLRDLQPGDRVSVVYEIPNGSPVAYRIRKRTAAFEGVVETIDLSARKLKTRQGSGEQKFAVGDHCQVMLSGERTGHLKDLMPGSEYRFSYEKVNGINVLDRVSELPAAKTAKTASLR